jgi:hypothetical protein
MGVRQSPDGGEAKQETLEPPEAQFQTSPTRKVWGRVTEERLRAQSGMPRAVAADLGVILKRSILANAALNDVLPAQANPYPPRG